MNRFVENYETFLLINLSNTLHTNIKGEFMRKRNVFNNRTKVASGNRRRLMLKRLHQKVILRRQQYQQVELLEELEEAC